jgi:hypothetical protein
MLAPADPFFGICACRNCGGDYRPTSEEDDYCYACQTAPVEEGLHDGEYPCMNCGQGYSYSPAGPIGFCSSQCSRSALTAITDTRDWRM